MNEFILNELSLSGQFSDVTDFSDNGIRHLTEALGDIRTLQNSAILKKSDFYQSKVTPQNSFHEIIFSTEARLNDRIRKFKGQLAALQNEPYWDNATAQTSTAYMRTDSEKGEDVTSTGVAEACARKACLISFRRSGYEKEIVKVKTTDDDTIHNINNICKGGQLITILYDNGIIGFDKYIAGRFRQKLNFSKIDKQNGFSLIDEENKKLVIDCFSNFENKTWQQIITDDALDYKPFDKNKKTKHFFSGEHWEKGIFKFRIDSKKRCFGYRENDIFYVLRFDMQHKLSDKG